MNQLENFSNTQKIAFIGSGNMASAIISGLIASNWPANQIIASNPSNPALGNLKLDALASQFNLKVTNDNIEAVQFADIVILAVKPQKLAQVCSHLSTVDVTEKLIISIAAGSLIEKIESHLQQKPAIIRAMPNTPAIIRKGATGLFATNQVSAQQKMIAESIFQAIGHTCWLNKESDIDVVTAIAGSSPAYLFLMMQSMIEQAVSLGMPEKQAFELTTQAVSGAAQLAQAKSEKSLQTLREEVTSPGGTTAAALSSFERDNFESIIKKAVSASAQRGKELANQS